MPLNAHIEAVYSYNQSRGDDRLAEANILIDHFLLFVRDNEIGNDLLDEVELPICKNTLVKSFLIAIAAERRPNVRALLIKAGLSLSQYRRGLGDPIHLNPITPSGRPRQQRSPMYERRLRRALLETAEERVRLSDLYQRAWVESYN